MPPCDHCGYEIAVDMVLASRAPGRHSKDCLQFDTVRKLRTAYGNFERCSSVAAHNNVIIQNDADEVGEIVSVATSSLWFTRFVKGCKARMEKIHRPNLGSSTLIDVKLLSLVSKYVREATSIEEQFDLVVFGSFITCSYVLSLRGSEGTMINLATLNKHKNVSVE